MEFLASRYIVKGLCSTTMEQKTVCVVTRANRLGLSRFLEMHFFPYSSQLKFIIVTSNENVYNLRENKSGTQEQCKQGNDFMAQKKRKSHNRPFIAIYMVVYHESAACFSIRALFGFIYLSICVVACIQQRQIYNIE
jgi:hypothetical protein